MEQRKVDNAGNSSHKGLNKSGIYTGSVSAAGAISNVGDSGFTAAAPVSSVFTVTHSLGLTADSYTVVCGATGTAEGSCTVTSKGANTFTVTPFDESATPALADLPFDFMMIVGDNES